MTKQRVITICLDGFDMPFAHQMMADGKLKGLSKLMDQSARFDLRHGEDGRARNTGLTMEHFTSGQSPETSGRWSSISFNPETYAVAQYHAYLRPFLDNPDLNVVVLDQPYMVIDTANNIQGAIGWYGNDTGTAPKCRPADLIDELNAKFGRPSANVDLNESAYASVEATKEMAAELVRSATLHGKAAKWMLEDKFHDWDVAVISFAEAHDAIEMMNHGNDHKHHYGHLPSAPYAKQGMENIYQAISDGVDLLTTAFPDAAFVAFTMHGMGTNDADVSTMAMLPEFMFRFSMKDRMFSGREDWTVADTPVLAHGENWEQAINAQIKTPLGLRLKNKLTRMMGGGFNVSYDTDKVDDANLASHAQGVEWMPGARYRPFWPQMKAFAVPSFFYGRVRINLKGREAHGIVDPADYITTLNEIERELRTCVDTKTGLPVIKDIVRMSEDDPMALSKTQSDLEVLWNECPVGFRHPVYGQIGPVPMRRVGGHAGDLGAMFVRASGVDAGDYGLRSSYDVPPTILDLAESPRPNRIDGESVLPLIRTTEKQAG